MTVMRTITTCITKSRRTTRRPLCRAYGAWVINELKAEHERGITIDIALWKPRLPSTTSPSSTLPVKLRILSDGRTHKHALLAFTLGVRQPLIASQSTLASDPSSASRMPSRRTPTPS
ncbi:hypothetical protein CF326_g8982 [Tilletia indica]|nr:hypothetical protein CF326_g8982 [Tilletia indica]